MALSPTQARKAQTRRANYRAAAMAGASAPQPPKAPPLPPQPVLPYSNSVAPPPAPKALCPGCTTCVTPAHAPVCSLNSAANAAWQDFCNKKRRPGGTVATKPRWHAQPVPKYNWART